MIKPESNVKECALSKSEQNYDKIKNNIEGQRLFRYTTKNI
ncbi:hypothetical protein TSAR_004928 [Trichomalopsis sarcophagae]|uniref:Uncharacterized protein n=1 Tax=Trichomalopsis sarcophagae TaxID=543379 RepID=A0A232F9A7_9HYME|nr:hypothetical protein TSAR_004928 [Trichomalopsis sarcophagae]